MFTENGTRKQTASQKLDWNWTETLGRYMKKPLKSWTGIGQRLLEDT
jgi:hypothetical protein